MSAQSRSTIKNVVFDLGGVLIDWNPRYLYRKLGAEEEEIEWFLANVCTSTWNHQQDAGRTFEEAVEELLGSFPEHEEWIRLYYERWEEMLGGTFPGTVEILRELKAAGTPLFALTNWSAQTFPRALELYDFLQLFDGIVVSGQLGCAKPDPTIYRHLTDRFGIEPAESVFIDDLEKNTTAAARLGFHTVQFKSPEQLRERLQALGVLDGVGAGGDHDA